MAAPWIASLHFIPFAMTIFFISPRVAFYKVALEK